MAEICFVISEIGKPGSAPRKRADHVLKHIIKPAAEGFGYKVVRADAIAEAGVITRQIIDHVMNAEIVVADLTNHNANVFYELALRHAVRKPCIQLIQSDQPIPFDTSHVRTIYVDYPDWDSIPECVEELKSYIQNMREKPDNVSSPISDAIDLMSLASGEVGQGDVLVQLLDEIALIRRRLDDSPNQDNLRGHVARGTGPGVDAELRFELSTMPGTPESEEALLAIEALLPSIHTFGRLEVIIRTNMDKHRVFHSKRWRVNSVLLSADDLAHVPHIDRIVYEDLMSGTTTELEGIGFHFIR